MIFVVLFLLLALVAQGYLGWKEREKLVRRIHSPQQVIVEEAQTTRHPPPERVFTDKQYKKLMEERGQIPRGENQMN